MPNPPGFVLKPVANRTVGGIGKTVGLVLHVQAGNGALSGWFNNPSASASSTWWAGKKGEREQYGNPDTDKFWAQAAGNPTYHSIETEGVPTEPLTDAQIETVAQAFAWGHLRYDWPLQLAEKPGDPGLGWHGMGGSAWGGHTGCPGDIRKAQRAQILARAKQIAGVGTPTQTPPEVDMPLTQADATTLLTGSAVMKNVTAKDPNSAPRVSAGFLIELAAKNSMTTVAQLAGLTAAVKALAESKPGVDADAILAAVKASVDAGVSSALADLSVTLSTKE
jgi:hypothetical protein